MKGTYSGIEHLRIHLANRIAVWGEESQPKWVNIFIHTLENVPINWYLETELRHGTLEWATLKESVVLDFIFESGFHSVDESL